VATTAHSVRVGSFFERVFERELAFLSAAQFQRKRSLHAIGIHGPENRVASAANCSSCTGAKVEADQIDINKWPS
jgi:hypothetical protein